MASNTSTTTKNNNGDPNVDVSSSIGAYAVRVTQEVGKAMTEHLAKHMEIQRTVLNRQNEQDRNQTPATTANQESGNSMVSMTVDEFETMMSVQKKSWAFVTDLMKEVGDKVQAMTPYPSAGRNNSRVMHADHLQRQQTLDSLGIFLDERNPRTPQRPSATDALNGADRRNSSTRSFAAVAAGMAAGNIEATIETQTGDRSRSPPPVPCPPPPRGALAYTPFQAAAILSSIDDKKLRRQQVKYFRKHRLVPPTLSRTSVSHHIASFRKGTLDENRTWNSKGGRPPICDKAEFLARAEAAMAVHGETLDSNQVREILMECRKERMRRMGIDIVGNVSVERSTIQNYAAMLKSQDDGNLINNDSL